MDTHKTILIDGANTVMHNGFFIQDHIPRQLAKFIDDEYKIYLIYENYDDKQMWENSKYIPDWCKTTIILQDFDFLLNEKDNFSKKGKDTIVITKRPTFFKDFDFKILTYTSKFDKLNVADVIFCFGFSKLDFLRFCKESKLIGVYDSKFFDKDNLNADGVAFMVKNDDFNIELEFSIACMNKLISNNMYKIKHRKKAIGITYQGEGLISSEINIGETNLPLILV